MREYLSTLGTALPPEEVATLQAAFNAAWEQLVADSASSAYKPDAELRTRLAEHIVEVRQEGEIDPTRIAALAVMRIATPPARH